MPNIPGIPSGGGGGVPGLGRGFPGGAGALSGLSGPPLLPGIPSGQALPRVAIPPTGRIQIPGVAVTGPNLTPANTAADQHAKLRIDTALTVLDRVRRGQMEPSVAAKILDDLEPTEKQTLIRSVLNEHAKNGGPSPAPVLQALRYLPGAEGKAHSTQNYAGAGKGIGSALISDASDAIRGLPAGLGLAGISAAEDIKDLPGDIIHARPVGRNLYNKVLTPIGKGIAHEYGPLASGNFGEFGHRFAQHPLGPTLDVAALASGGLGGAARTSDALAAIRAARVTELGGARLAAEARGAARARPLVSPEELAAKPYMGRIAGFFNRKTGELHLAPPGEGHGWLDENIGHGQPPEDILELNINLDDTGHIGKIHVEENVKDPKHDYHNLEPLKGPEADNLRKQVTDELYSRPPTTAPEPTPSPMIEAKQPVPSPSDRALVGDKLTVQQQKDGMWLVRRGNNWI